MFFPSVTLYLILTQVVPNVLPLSVLHVLPQQVSPIICFITVFPRSVTLTSLHHRPEEHLSLLGQSLRPLSFALECLHTNVSLGIRDSQ